MSKKSFRTPAESADRKAFIIEANKTELEQQDSLWSLANLKKLEPDELVDRLERVENQSVLIKWRILWALRQKFPSDKLFGQYLANIRDDATRPNWLSSPRDISRSVAAGRFCEQHRITDLNAIGVYQSSIYALSSPANEDIADSIFAQIRKKNIPNKDVERMIAQAKAVLTIEQQPQPQQPERISYGDQATEEQEQNHLQSASVVNGVTIGESQAEEGGFGPFDDLDIEEARSGGAMAERAITPNPFDSITMEDLETPEEAHYRAERSDLINQLAALDSAYMSDKQILDEWAALEKGYERKDKELIELYKQRINALSSWYPAR
jgi:hypothetical protein